MFIVIPQLIDMASTSKHLLNVNVGGIVNLCFSYSENCNSDSNDKKMTEILQLLQSLLCV
jgi:hypothetical protein